MSLVALAVLATVVAKADAGLPQASDPVIKPARSLGGVRLGMDRKEAKRAWGSTSDYCSERGCNFGPKNESKGYASLFFRKDEVVQANITATFHYGSGSVYTDKMQTPGRRLMRFHTPGGIKIGDAGTLVKEEFSRAKLIGKATAGTSAWYVAGPGDAFMSFGMHNGSTIHSITLGNTGNPSRLTKAARLTAPAG